MTKSLGWKVELNLCFSCQTYEGGFSGCPGMEAHGGYAFCGLSALIILGKGHLCDLQALLVIKLEFWFKSDTIIGDSRDGLSTGR